MNCPNCDAPGIQIHVTFAFTHETYTTTGELNATNITQEAQASLEDSRGLAEELIVEIAGFCHRCGRGLDLQLDESRWPNITIAGVTTRPRAQPQENTT